jgi:chitinase
MLHPLRLGAAAAALSFLLVAACDGGDDGSGGAGSTAASGGGAASSGGSGGSGGSGAAGGSGGASSTSGSGGGGGGGMSDLESILPPALFEELFLHRGTAPCQGGFYTYEAFLAAAQSFPAFASEGSDEARRREVAAFLANIAHETTGGWASAPDGPYSWGLCWITEGGAVDPSGLPDYCAPSAEWPCASGKKYFGRGPMQLSWNYNYGQCGEALGLDLLADPDRVSGDPEVAFRAALWFWMTPQAPKPSCHDVMTGQWTPTPQDEAAGRLPGFGMTVNIINGGLECGQPTPPQVTDRLGFYDHFTQILATTPGEHLECASMQPY